MAGGGCVNGAITNFYAHTLFPDVVGMEFLLSPLSERVICANYIFLSAAAGALAAER